LVPAIRHRPQRPRQPRCALPLSTRHPSYCDLDARRHVNRMCMAGNVPLVESGTAGYLGQVQPLLKDRTECFDCIPKPTPKTYPVCTIRSTPSQPIHCIVWSKSYLMGCVSHPFAGVRSSTDLPTDSCSVRMKMQGQNWTRRRRRARTHRRLIPCARKRQHSRLSATPYDPTTAPMPHASSSKRLKACFFASCILLNIP